MLQVNATFEKIWNVISKVDNDPNYWKNIIHIKNISSDRNIITREIQLSNGNKCQQKITLFSKERIHIQWTKGPIVGTKDIMLINNGGTVIIRIQMDYRLDKVASGGSTSVLDELQSEAEYALRLIKKQVEHTEINTRNARD